MAIKNPTLSLLSALPSHDDADALVLAVSSAGKSPHLLPGVLDNETTAAISESLQTLGVTGSSEEVAFIPGGAQFSAKIIVLAGVGDITDAGDLSPTILREVSGAVARKVSERQQVIFALPNTTAEQLEAIAEGALLGAYRYGGYRKAEKDQPKAKPTQNRWSISEIAVLNTELAGAQAETVLQRAQVMASATAHTRNLVNQAPNFLYPESFVNQAKDLAKSLPIKFTVWDEKKLERDGFGGLIGVGQGSEHPPRLVKLEYTPATVNKRVALVGKGITFDSGGLSLKPATSMDTMKLDMGGAASVLCAVLAAAQLKLDVAVTGWLCLAENAPSGTAQRPSDVITIYGGTTVEVKNTDAEGRLVMADALVAASLETPDELIDVATLTGAQMIALGNRTAGVMGESELTQAIVKASEASGEAMWAMPVPEYLRKSLNSKVADISNIGDKFGGMLTAASFLKEFVGKKGQTPIAWAHIDIAGPAFNDGEGFGYTPSEATGFSTRTLITHLAR